MSGPSLPLIVVAATDGFPNMSWAILDGSFMVICAEIAVPDENSGVSDSDVTITPPNAEDDVIISAVGIVTPNPAANVTEFGLRTGDPDVADIFGKLGC